MSKQKKRHTPEQIVRKLGQADRLLEEGKTVADVCENSRSLSKPIIGGMKADGLVDWSITADRFIEHLEELIMQRGAPAVLRSDKGPDFIASAVTE